MKCKCVCVLKVCARERITSRERRASSSSTRFCLYGWCCLVNIEVCNG